MGKFTLIYGPMFAGKTEELLRVTTREEIAENKVLYFKPSIDKRYSNTKIMTHSLGGKEAYSVEDTKNLIEIINHEKWDVVAIDEIQFFDSKIIDFIKYVIDSTDKYLIASGLVLDFRAEPFPLKDFASSKKTMADLLVYAEPKRLQAICTYKENGKICGKPADYTQRIINNNPADYNSPIILVGSTESYEARCKNHHFLPGRKISRLEDII